MCAICPSWLSFILYNPLRKVLTNRLKVLEESGIDRDSVVLEVGAGNGFFTEVIATRASKVYAAELQPGMVKKLRKRVAMFNERVEVIEGDIATENIGESFADVCFMYYSFHEIDRKEIAAEKINRSIKKGGLLSIYEPAIEVSKEAMRKTVEMFERLGLKKELERDGLVTRFARLRKIQ